MRFSPLMLLSVLAGCGGPPDPRGIGHDETLLEVSATGTSEATPDEARFSAGVSTIAGDGPTAARLNAEKMAKVVAALKEQGIEDRDLKTQQVTVARQDWGPNRGKFEANNVIEARVRAIDKAGAAIGAASTAGANVLSGPDLRVSDQEAASKGAYAAAYQAARSRADAYAAAAGLVVKRVLIIRDGDAGGPQPMYAEMAMDRMAAQTVAPPVMAGTDTTHAAVRVSFALGRK